MNNIGRIELLIDHDTWIPMDKDKITTDVLGFSDDNFLHNRITNSQEETSLPYAVQTDIGHLDGKSIGLGVMEFSFM